MRNRVRSDNTRNTRSIRTLAARVFIRAGEYIHEVEREQATAVPATPPRGSAIDAHIADDHGVLCDVVPER